MKWLIVLGIVLTIAGVILAFLSFRFHSRVMGAAALGVAVLHPDKGSAVDLERQRLRRRSDRLFIFGLILAGVGGVMQAVGTALQK